MVGWGLLVIPVAADGSSLDAHGSCDPTAVRLSRRDAPELPARLTHAALRRRADGRWLEVAVASEPVEVDARGRFVPVTAGHARLVFEAVRVRRRPLSARDLVRAGARRARSGYVHHVRVASAGPLFTIAGQDVRKLSLTHVDATRVCGFIDAQDAFGRVQGAFDARVIATTKAPPS